MAACVYCRCDRLGAVVEPLELGAPVICGACAGIMVVDVEDGEAIVRRPTPDESRELRARDDVKAFLVGRDAAMLEEAATTPAGRGPKVRIKSKTGIRVGRNAPITIRGPDAR